MTVTRGRTSNGDAAAMSRRVFLDIPYKRTYRKYEEVIRAALLARGLTPVVSRDHAKAVVILQDVCELIDSCRYAVIDISGANFNVALEAGYIIAHGRPYILLKNRRTKPPADLSGIKYLEYRDVASIRRKIVHWIGQNMPEARDLPEVQEARHLIERLMKGAGLTRQQAEEVLLSALQPEDGRGG